MAVQKNNITNSYFSILNLMAILLLLCTMLLAGTDEVRADPASTEAVSESHASTANSYTIGVLAFRGEDKALKRWTPTAEYLSRQIPGSQFNILPLGLEELRQAVEKNQIDFLLTNTGHYVEMEAFYGASEAAAGKQR